MAQDDSFSVSEMERRKRRMNGGDAQGGGGARGYGGRPAAAYPPDAGGGGGDPYYYDDGASGMRDNINVRHYWDVVKRRWLVVALCVITVTAISVAYSFTILEDVYQAAAVIQRRTASPTHPGDRYGAVRAYITANEDAKKVTREEVCLTAAELLLGKREMTEDRERVALVGRTDLSPASTAFVRELKDVYERGKNPGAAAARVAGMVSASAETDELRPTFVRVTATGAMRDLLAPVANGFAEAYRLQNLEEIRAYAQQKSEFFRDLAQKRFDELASLHQNLTEQRKKLGLEGSAVFDPAAQRAEIKALERRVEDKKLRKLELESIITGLSRSRSGKGGMEAEIGEMESERKALLLRYREAHPRVRMVTQMLKEKRKALKDYKEQDKEKQQAREADREAELSTPQLIQHRAELEAVNVSIGMLDEKIKQTREKAAEAARNVKPEAREIVKIEAEIESLQDRISKLQAQAAVEAEKAKSELGTIEVVFWAGGARQVAPKRVQNALLGLLAGAILGVLAAFFLEYVDDTAKTATDIEREINMECLGVVPLWGDSRSVFMSPVVHDTPASEAFAQLRNSVRYAGGNEPEKLLLIASAVQDEGKTAVATNMAISFNTEGNKVLLVNTDLRRGGTGHISRVLLNGKDCPVGLSEFLRIQPGHMLKNPARLLHSERIAEVFRYGEREFDVVIIDSAAVLPVVDTTLFSSMVRGVLLVVAAERTSISYVKQALKRLRHVNSPPVGAVLNMAREYSHGAYYYYYSYSAKSGGKPPVAEGGVQ
jgi:capsular exopolysaccharide synthesis family protein